MRTKIILFFPVLFCLLNFGYLFYLAKASPSDHVQENRKNKGLLSKLSRSNDRAELVLAQQIKYGHGVGGRGVGGGNAGGSVGGGARGGASGEGKGHGSSSSGRQQGMGVIPVYAAGAANNHHKKRNGGNSMKGYPLFTVIVWAVLEVVITNPFYV